MKTVSAAFLAAQAKSNLKFYFEINMFRRYWDVATQTYLWEASATDIKPYVLGKSNISWQLDTEGLNVWRTSNVQLELKNDNGEWNETGDHSLFNTTYLRYKSKIEVKIGYILADGSTETVYNFTGIIVGDLTNNFLKKTVVVNLSGKEILLTLASAENVCQTVTGETLGTGALSVKYFTTNPYTLAVGAVYKDGSLVSAADYTVTQLYNEYHGALITFDTAPGSNVLVTADYTYGNNQIAEAEQIGTGSLEANFETAELGVGFIDAVYVDGAALTEGVDYTAENLNEKELPAKIVFPFGVGPGQVITCDYRHWYMDVAMETLVGYLLDAAGFPAADRTIGSIDVGALTKYKIWDTKPEFDAMDSLTANTDTATLGEVAVVEENISSGIAENINVTITGAYPNQSAAMTLASADFANKYEAAALPPASSPAWTEYSSGTHTHEISPASTLHLQIAATSSSDQLFYQRDEYPYTLKHFKMRLKLSCASATGAMALAGFFIGIGNVYIRCQTDGSSYFYWTLYTYGGGYIDLGLNGQQTWNDYHVFEIKMIGTELVIYMDGAYLATTDYGIYARGSAMGWTGVAVSSGTLTMDAWVDYAYDSTEVLVGKLTSNAFDLGAGCPAANLGTMLATKSITADGSILQVFTQTSTTPDFSSGNDSWREVTFVSAVGTISASTAAYRYLRWKALFCAGVATSPTLSAVYMPGHLTEKLDCGTNLSSYDSFFSILTNNNGLIKIYTSSSANDITYEAEAEVVAGVIASTQQRYIRFRTVMYYTAAGTSPKLFKEYFTYKISSLNVALANFTGMTVDGAIEEFAKILDYEKGVGSDGKYFFRAKNASLTVDMELSDKTNIISVDNDSSGWARIFNYVKVKVGRFTAIMSPVTEAEALPHSITKYGQRNIEIESSAIDIDNDLDLSSSLATIYYGRYVNPKRELRLLCKMLPQLELSDTIQLQYGVPAWYWRLGDPAKFLGALGTIFFSKDIVPSIFTYNLIANVVGLELDINTFRLYVSVREI